MFKMYRACETYHIAVSLVPLQVCFQLEKIPVQFHLLALQCILIVLQLHDLLKKKFKYET